MPDEWTGQQRSDEKRRGVSGRQDLNLYAEVTETINYTGPAHNFLR